MEKHEFIPTDLINWCGFGMKRDENGDMDESEACCEPKDHPIHTAQPEQAQATPHQNCTCPLCMPHLWAAGIKGAGNAQAASEETGRREGV